MEKPVLSIGMIFKNEVRCLERCLKSLQPLRDAVPCELVMADTGSDDGSREIAERYADILFDFPWINDFAAARNAVMDRCSGQWYLTIDSDEWLEDIDELVGFLRAGDRRAEDACILIQRNYGSRQPGAEYMDFEVVRMARMSGGLRYQGAIHEHWPVDGVVTPLYHTVLHHDGYACQDTEAGKAKKKRNMDILRGELELEPESMRTLLLCIESGELEPDYLELVRRGVAAVAKKVYGWENYGPPILRYAVKAAQGGNLPELDEWISMAEDWFPKSLFTRIDVEYIAFVAAWDQKDYPQCVRRGERYLQAVKEDSEGACGQTERMFSAIMLELPSCQRHLRIMLAWAHLHTGEAERAAELLGQLDGAEMDAEQTRNFTLLLQELHMKTQLDTASFVASLWERISVSEPTPKRAAERKAAFCRAAQGVFRPDAYEGEKDICRPVYTLYLPLRDQCDLGRAAAILETDDQTEMETLLAQVEHWEDLPIHALAHALECGVEFPLAEKPLNIEEMDGLATRLSQNRSSFFSLAGPALTGLLFRWGPDLAWARAIALTAVQVNNWDVDAQDSEQGLALARAFAEVEERFLPCCYASEALREDGLYMLPPMHRFGWWCAKAFDALDAGDAVGYTRCLREGLNTCSTMKPMVEFLMEHTPELQAPPPSAELLALAEQIRTILDAYPPDDPAVAALKQSEAYQRVAYLIEGTEPPIFGGQLQ